jgi:hypothetical protein
MARSTGPAKKNLSSSPAKKTTVRNIKPNVVTKSNPASTTKKTTRTRTVNAAPKIKATNVQAARKTVTRRTPTKATRTSPVIAGRIQDGSIIRRDHRVVNIPLNRQIITGLRGDKNSRYKELRALINNPPHLRGMATRHSDGRYIPIVLGMVHDTLGRTRAGIRVVLEDEEGHELHSIRTTPNGAFALRFPTIDGERITHGRVRLLIPDAPEPKDVSIPHGAQHAMIMFSVEKLPLHAKIPVGVRRNATTNGNGHLRTMHLALTGTIGDTLEETVDETTGTAEETVDETTDTIEGTTGTVEETVDTTTETTEGTTGTVTDPLDPTLDPDDPAAVLDPVVDLIEETGDDPFDVLPVDMTPELCDAVGHLFGPGVDTILTNPSRANDFRSRRTRLIKHMTVPRVAPAAPGEEAPRRYLATVRQEWKFLGYTLGEVADIDPLAPGSIIKNVSQLVSESVDRTSSSTREVQNIVRSVLETTETRMTNIETLLEVTNELDTETGTTVTTSTNAGVGPKSRTGSIVGGIVGGILGGPLGALVGAGIGSGGVEAGLENVVDTQVTSSLESKTVTRTEVDTSLEVNSRLREAQSALNLAVSEVSSAVRTLRQTTDETLDQVSPLVSRVTNLLRWRLYENYMVCSKVEDVVELRDYPIFGATDDEESPLFEVEDIVEYRRFFQPNLLEPRLAPHFGRLATGLARARMAEIPTTSVRVVVRYQTNGISGGELEVRLGSDDDTRSKILTLTPGSTVASGVIPISEAVAIEDLEAAHLDLSVQPGIVNVPTRIGHMTIPIPTPDPDARVQVRSISLEYLPGRGRVQRVHLGNALTGTKDNPSVSHTLEPENPPVNFFPEFDPLFIHINRNSTHYFSVLLQAAKKNPALRDDIRQLVEAEIDGEGLLSSDSALWRLPIAGFEGNRILVVKDLDEDDDYGKQLLEDAGAGTLIQLAAPGSYGEALEGLLGLTDAVGKLHPGLLPAPAPVMPPLAVVDLAGKVISTTTNGQSEPLPEATLPES